jgi:hypothetical protein
MINSRNGGAGGKGIVQDISYVRSTGELSSINFYQFVAHADFADD